MASTAVADLSSPPAVAASSSGLGSGRQRAGAACEECRRRKLRCDGRRPQCGVCRDSGSRCEINPSRALRGPKKGYFKALNDRVAMLEGRLASLRQQESSSSPPGGEQQQLQQLDNQQLENQLLETQHMENQMLEQQIESHLLDSQQQSHMLDLDGHIDASSNSSSSSSSCHNHSLSASTFPDMLDGVTFSVLNSPSLITDSTDPSYGQLMFQPPEQLRDVADSLQAFSSSSPNISEIMHAELDQLYFDRVHVSIPLLHQRRYLSWSKQRDKTLSRMCLQRAMWTLSTLMSLQFQYLQLPLYNDTKQMLELLNCTTDLHPKPVMDTEHIQARVLLSIYELVQNRHEHAWLSSGRSFRLALMMKLHEIDAPTPPESPSPSPMDHREMEERRRVFWMAYLVDFLLGMRQDWPTFLSNITVYTRLPAPDAEFQSGMPVLGDFLCNALAKSDPQNRSTFNLCILFATICERNIANGRRSSDGFNVSPSAEPQLERYQQLDGMLSGNIQTLSDFYPSPSESNDPMLLFASIFGQMAAIDLYQNMQMTFWAGSNESRALVDACQQRARAAITRVVNLVKTLLEFPFFHIHPLVPLALRVCTKFLYDSRSTHEFFGTQLQELLTVFRKLKCINDHTKSYVDLLEIPGM